MIQDGDTWMRYDIVTIVMLQVSQFLMLLHNLSTSISTCLLQNVSLNFCAGFQALQLKDRWISQKCSGNCNALLPEI